MESLPTELCEHIIDLVPSLDISKKTPTEPCRHVALANDQVLNLSCVNHHFRRLCLPAIFKHLIVYVTATYPADLSTLQRALERRPDYAALVKHIEIVAVTMIVLERQEACRIDSILHLFPNITRLDFPPGIPIDMNLVLAVNSHPSPVTVYCLTLYSLRFFADSASSLPPGFLSRVCVRYPTLPGSHWLVPLLTTCGLRIQHLMVGPSSPPFFDSTIPGLIGIYITTSREDIREELEPLWWLPQFLERHPQLRRVNLVFSGLERHRVFTAIKNCPLLKSFHDAIHSQHSFVPMAIIMTSMNTLEKHFMISEARIYIDRNEDIIGVLRLLGSQMPFLSKLMLQFSGPCFFGADEFVAVLTGQFSHLQSLELVDVDRFLTLVHLTENISDTHRAEEADGEVFSDDDPDRTAQVAQLAWLFASKGPRLSIFEFAAGKFRWFFSVERDGSKVTQLIRRAHRQYL